MLARSLDHIIILLSWSSFDPNVKYNFGSPLFLCDFWPVLFLKSTNIFSLGFASKQYDQTDSRAPKCLTRVIKTVMDIVKGQLKAEGGPSMVSYQLRTRPIANHNKYRTV
jgi:hypothetical protein